WATANALKVIAKKLRVSHRRMGQAGTKDKRAVTTQLASAFEVPKESILALRMKDIKINGAWTAPDKVRMGELLGNRFTIMVSGAGDGADEKVSAIAAELGGRFPNYFGEQRFGTTRKNTHIVGEQLLRNRFDKAAMAFLSDYDGEMHEGAREARKTLAESQDFRKALQEFPKHLVMERSMLAHLEKRPNDFANAFRKLPRSILLLFVHAFQSHLFNKLLSERLSEMREDGSDGLKPEDGEFFCGESHGFPDLEKKQESGWLAGKLLGYESSPNERERMLLDECRMRTEDFRVRGLPEIGSKGSFRTFFSPLKDFSFADSAFRFSLGSGCYATTALREFIDINK
ncbi:TPA: tRNA pseudouridine(13) synthase TruD, partial [Candidatus Micrarchaeota archaeon]|nr:tRNA pseudouridine(13) synthase TruD [Candidatus Micrarchaeota archaeon]